MCGIYFAASRNGHTELSENVSATLRARGPDSLVVHHTTSGVPSTEIANCYLTFASSVLSLRGDQLCIQPLVEPRTGSVLCWNGEAWRINGSQVTGNDSQVVFETLLDALTTKPVNDNAENPSRSQRILNVLTSIAGPYAFVFYDAEAATVYYGRDRLGRRSLNSTQILHRSESNSANDLILSSVSISHDQAEVTTNGVHYLKLHNKHLAPEILLWPQPTAPVNKSIPDGDLLALPSENAVDALEKQILNSLQLRVMDIPKHNHPQNTQVRPSKLAILFSGGLDCTLLARLCHDVMPLNQPIDLLNVAFENPRTVKAASSAAKNASAQLLSPYESCPDRATGRSSYAELTRTCSVRDWRFVAINVPYAEVVSHRPKIIDLMRPHNTEMDLSIATALYFASRGQGATTVLDDPLSDAFPHETPARVLLSGLGADELFGGYARHAAAFSHGSWNSLNNELELDFTRIGSRNLGRDDRVMSYWAREVRYPFLDEEFTRYALGLPAWEKCGFRPDKEIPKHFKENKKQAATSPEDLDPAKLILRCLMWKKGMTGVAAEKKRAIQFGARTAKMEGGRTKGTDLLS